MNTMNFLTILLSLLITVSCDNNPTNSNKNSHITTKDYDLYVFTDKNYKCGYMDSKGNIKINPQFDDAYRFNNESGLAIIIQQGKRGFINTNGEIVIPPQFESAGSFGQYDLVAVKKMVNSATSIGQEKCL